MFIIGDRVRVIGYLTDYPQDLLCKSDLKTREKINEEEGEVYNLIGKYACVKLDSGREVMVTINEVKFV